MSITNGYCTVEQLCNHMGIDYDPDSEITRMENAINAASRSIDEFCGQFFYDAGSAAAIVLKADHPRRLWVPTFSTLTGLVVKTDEGDNGTYNQTWTVTTDYIADPYNGVDTAGRTVGYRRILAVGGRSFPTYGLRPRCQITIRQGFTAVPTDIYEASLLKSARLFRRTESPDGSAGGFTLPTVKISRREDPDVADMLGPWVRTDQRPVLM